jgi:tetratricopeptide (TPR) repeat protein
MLQPEDLRYENDDEQDFGMLLKILRSQKKVKQRTIVSLLPGWTTTAYTRLENGEIAPHFDQLLPLYHAFQQAGIRFSLAARQNFVKLARKKIQEKKTHRDIRTDAEWAELRYQLTRSDQHAETSTYHHSQRQLASRPLLAETNHLIGREAWREDLLKSLRGSSRKKLVVIRGPMGIGKSSELNWMATHLLHQSHPSYQTILCDFASVERASSPEGALDVFLGTVLAEFGFVQPEDVHSPLEERMRILFEQVERSTVPIVILVDNSECLLQTQGALANCWERFLTRFLRSQHRATIFLATRQWPGWFGGEHLFVAEAALPPLSREQGVLLLQQLGLDVVPVSVLQDVYTAVGGIPLCLEWVAALVKQSFSIDDWEELGIYEPHGITVAESRAPDMIQAIQRLLADPHVFGGNLADAIAPILDRIISSQRLSSEAQYLLEVLSTANVPLAKPALEVICMRGPHPIKELRRASLLVAYPNRVQLLPMVAAAVIRHLTPEQTYEREELLLQAYTAWLREGEFYESEKGPVITELAVLLLRHRRLLEAAQLLIEYGWMSFTLGHGALLAQLAGEVMEHFDWKDDPLSECGGLLLHHTLGKYLGEKTESHAQAEAYQRVRQLAATHDISLELATEVHLLHHLMLDLTNERRFSEAQDLFEECYERMSPSLAHTHPGIYAALQSNLSYLLGTWGEHEEELGNAAESHKLRERAIAIYQECIQILRRKREAALPLERSTINYQLGRMLNDMGYYLVCLERAEEAITALEESIELKRRGFSKPGSLAMSLGELAQALGLLGRFQEALAYNQAALEDTQKLAAAGHSIAQRDIPVHQIDRARLLIRRLQLDEAKRLIDDALPQIRESRRIYRRFAQKALDEIAQCRAAAVNLGRPYLDWRWYARFKDAVAYDVFGWLAHAGPFTEDEQEEWQGLFSRSDDEATRRMAAIIKASRERELAAALEEQREPHLHYPAIPIYEVQQRITTLETLRVEINEEEPNAVVRRLYSDAIEEHVWYLQMVQATYDGDTSMFWACNRLIHAEPTPKEMADALSYARDFIYQGLQNPLTTSISTQLLDHLQRLSTFPSLDEGRQEHRLDESFKGEGQQQGSQAFNGHKEQYLLSPLAVKRFFEAVLREYRFEGWRVHLDEATNNLRIEPNIRTIFLHAGKPMSVARVRELLSHEIECHVFRAEAGKQSALALLFLGTRGALQTEEGLALYYDQETARIQGETVDESTMSTWVGTLATGLASGVLTPPQTFYNVYTLFESLYTLYRVLSGKDHDISQARVQADRLALNRCLRTFRGVPDLNVPGICYAKDAIYLRGYRAVSRAIQVNPAVLEQLMVGAVALEHLPDIAELGIVSPPGPPQWLAHRPDLDAYITSFESAESAPIEGR